MFENFKLSPHSNSLGVLEKTRYIEKLKLAQCNCPYIIPGTTLGKGIPRVKDVVVRDGWHPRGVVPKRNSRCGPNPTHPIKN